MDDEEDAAGAEHEEGGEGYAVGLVGADGVPCLGYVADDHADGGKVAYDVDYECVCVHDDAVDVFVQRGK